MKPNCKIKNCKKEVFNNDTCLFHCKKDDWYQEESLNGKKLKRWDDKLLENFWDQFYLYIQNNKDCTQFIFPKFDYYIEISYEDAIHKRPLTNSTLSSLDFSKSHFIDGLIVDNVKIYNCKFNQCSFSYLQILGSEIDNCSFHGVRFDSAYLDGNNIQKTNFQWLDTDYISFLYSKISESNFNNSYFKTLNLEHTVVSDTSFQNTTIISGNIHTFRILKSYFFNINDNINGNYHYSREMQEYCKDIIFSPYYSFKSVIQNTKSYFKYDNYKRKGVGHIYRSIQELFGSMKTFFMDGPLLIWSFVVSNYGQNWILPLIWLFLSSYVIYRYINPNIDFNINEFSMFMNPFIKNTDKYDNVYALWMFHKLLESIFIYQFIVAVRRRTNR